MNNIFQIVLIGVFIVALVLAVLIFAGIIPIGTDKPGAQGTVVIWGTLRSDQVTPLIEDLNSANQALRIVYGQKNPATFDADLVEALAAGRGPDLFFMGTDSILRNSDKIYPIPYQSYPIKNFRDTFIQEGEIYLGTAGILGLPLTVDPLVMYYNRDMFQSAGISKPPETWDDLVKNVPLLTVKDKASNILKSAVGMGQYQNISHAKELVSLLILQLGNPIVQKDELGVLSSVLAERGSFGSPDQALQFYVDFANPVKNVYSWSRALPVSRDAFIAGDLAVYFGYASELFDIQDRNPNLNFDVSKIPQAKGIALKTTYGKMSALAISKASKNLPGAVAAAYALTSQDFINKLSAAAFIPPVRRDLLAVRPPGLYLPIFYDSALIARSWLDPADAETDKIFRTMIEDSVSGRNDVPSAVGKAASEINLLIRGRKI